MWQFFLQNNRFSYLILIALVAFGSYSLYSIPKESAPEVVVPVGIVSVALPGAPAADVETLVTNEIERALQDLSQVKEISSVSREGLSSITVEFEAEADLDASIKDLKDAVDVVKTSLPEDATEPVVSEVDFTEQPVLTVAVFADLDDREFSVLGDKVQDAVEAVTGVSRVSIGGTRDSEIAVIVDQSALLQYGISILEVVRALESANQSLPVGQIEQNGVAYNIAFEGNIEESEDILSVGVTSRGGQPVYVRDVASVVDGLSDPTSITRASVDGSPSKKSITLDVYKQSGGDITVITAAVNSRLAELQSSGEILENVEVLTVLDAGNDIREDLVRLSSSGLQTVVLVVILLVVAIGWREGLLAGLAIPLSFLFGFIGLYLSGNTINFLSLFALILGVGILVDSAIVMVEGINRRMKEDQQIDKKDAALQTIHEFKAPLIAGTLTTVSMFVGLFIVSGVIGQFIASIPFTLVFVLFASLFVALAIIPLLASSFLRRRNTTRVEELQQRYAEKFEAWYRNKLTPFIEDKNYAHNFLTFIFASLIITAFFAINVYAGLIAGTMMYFGSRFLFNHLGQHIWGTWKYRLLWLGNLVASLVVAVILMNTVLPSQNLVKVVFFEQSDVDFLIVELEEPEGTTKEVTDIASRRVEEILYDEETIESFVLTVGSGSDFGSGGTGEKLASFFITLRPDRKENSTQIVDRLRTKMATVSDLKVTVNQPSDGPPTGAAILVTFLGEDLNALTSTANQAALAAQSIDGVVNVETSTNNNSTEYVLDLDRGKAAALGLDLFTVSQLARTAVFGTEATSITTLDNDIKIIVKLNLGNQDVVVPEETNVTSIESLQRITIPTQSGGVSLSEVADLSVRESSTVIRHKDNERFISLTADVAGAANSRETQNLVLEKINEQVNIPNGVTISTGGGETEESNEAFLEMGLALIVGVLLMIGILVLQFNSYLHTRYVLSILPYSLIGIFTGLALTQNPLSFPSMMGFIALSGIVVNNSILLIDMMNQMRLKNPNKSLHDVVLDSATNRLRPIVLTTITTVIGMVPLTMAGDLWIPLAFAVMFGLLFSVVITLILIPIIYFNKPGEVMRR